MANYCIPPEIARTLIKKAKEGDVIGDIELLYNMTSKERRSAFAKHVGEATAQEINASFEQVMVSNQQKAMENWVRSTFSGQAKRTGQAKSAIDKINELSEKGLLEPEDTDAFLEDLVRDKLGISVSPQEASIIAEKARKLEELAKDVSEKTG